MKVTVKHRRGGATISIRAQSEADKRALTDVVMSGDLMRALNEAPKAQAGQTVEASQPNSQE